MPELIFPPVDRLFVLSINIDIESLVEGVSRVFNESDPLTKALPRGDREPVHKARPLKAGDKGNGKGARTRARALHSPGPP